MIIRIYSRAITSAFIILSGVACFIFPSLEGSFITVGIVASLLTLFTTYQNREATGWIYYTFLFLGVASVANIHFLVFIPIYWIMMIFINSLSLRTFIASFTGLFQPLTEVTFFNAYGNIPLSHYLTYAFMVILAFTGIIHFLRKSYNDKIRTRQFYYSIIFFDIVVLVLLALFPQYYDLLFRPAIILTSPLIGHFIALTRTKITNIAFYLILITALLLTGFNLWTSSFIF